MRKVLKRGLCTVLCVCLLMGMTGFQNLASNSNDNRYLEVVNSPSTTLDNVWYNPGGIFRCALFDSLLIPNADMTEYKCQLAKEYKIKDDKTYVFTLRDDVIWHDGETLDVGDVIFSIKTMLRCGEVNGIIESSFSYILGAKEYRDGLCEDIQGIVVDGNQITFQLTSPIGKFIEAIAQFAILPEHILKDVEPTTLAEHEYWKKPIGTGCYKITDTVEGEYFILEANEDYYGAAPGIKKLRMRLNVEDCVAEMKEGNLDFYVTNDPEEIAQLKGVAQDSEHPLNIFFPAYLIFNFSEDSPIAEFLKDARVRKALLLAIDREAIVDAIFPGSSVCDTMVPAWAGYYAKDIERYEFNPDKAKELLQEAGVDFNQTIRLRYSVKGQATKDMMNAIAVYWRAVGLQVDVEKFEGSGSEHMFEIRDFDVCYKRLSSFGYAPIYEEVQGEGVMQTALYNQPVYDELLQELEVTMDEAKRKELIEKMQKLDQEYMLRLPLFSLANVAYVNEESFAMPEAYGNLWYRYDLCFSEWRLLDK